MCLFVLMRQLRQTKGLIGSILALLGRDLAVPDHTTMSRRAETLAVPRRSVGTNPCSCWWTAAVQAMGVNTSVSKLQAFATGACIAGTTGALLASWQRSVFPDNFLFTESINVLAMVILGGMGSLPGVILGAAVIVALPEIFRP